MTVKQLALWLSLALLASTAVAQNYPSKTVRAIVPWPVGGGVDIMTRLITPRLGERLGQNIVVDNRGGGSGVIGGEIAARAPADGHHVLFDNITNHAINPALYRKMPYDTLKDFAPVSLIGWSTNVLIVHPSMPVRTLKEYIALAKARPGQISYAHFGIGGSAHLSGELLDAMAGIRTVHVPYKGGGPALADLVAGQIPVKMSVFITAAGAIKSGKARALAVTSAQRTKAAPDIATVAESGVPGYEANNWFGALVPAATPREIVARLHSELTRTLQAPELVERFVANGFDLQSSSAEEFGRKMQAETTKWAKVVKDSGVRLD